MGKKEYHKYLASREWALKKNAVMDRCKGICERCEIYEADQVHHKTYENVGREKLDELQALCIQCHEYISGKSDCDPLIIKLKKVENVDWGKPVLCPVCESTGDGFCYVHFCEPYIKHTDDCSAWDGRGDCVVIPMWCESGHSFDICFGFHKGNTYSFYRNCNINFGRYSDNWNEYEKCKKEIFLKSKTYEEYQNSIKDLCERLNV